jgi:hypothetical protein
VDAVFLGLLPTIVLVVAAVVLIETMRVREGGERYQHREYRPDKDQQHGNGSRHNGHRKPSQGNGSRPDGNGH